MITRRRIGQDGRRLLGYCVSRMIVENSRQTADVVLILAPPAGHSGGAGRNPPPAARRLLVNDQSPQRHSFQWLGYAASWWTRRREEAPMTRPRPPLSLLHRDALRKVPRHVDVVSSEHRKVVRLREATTQSTSLFSTTGMGKGHRREKRRRVRAGSLSREQRLRCAPAAAAARR